MVVGPFWEAFNSDESFLALYVFFSAWASGYIYSQWKGFVFHRWSELHNLHNVGSMVLATISLGLQDNSIFNERIVIQWNFSYFLVDLVDTLRRKDIPFVVHAVFSLFLGACNHQVPLFRELRMNSKATYLELSSPFMHRAKKTREANDFYLFSFVFTLCRIVWLPICMHQMKSHGVENTHPGFVAVVLFYILNLYWWYRILSICYDHVKHGKAPKKVD